MSSATTRLDLPQARELAWEIMSLLSPYCSKLCIAGSIRRNRPTVGDIELIAIPIVDRIEQHDMFGLVGQVEIDRLHARCIELVNDGQMATRPDKSGIISFGARAKRLTYRDFGLDLFAVKPPTAQWGVIHLLRTGSAAFSKRLVTHVGQGGWMPSHIRCRAGALWSWGELVETPTEAHVFEAIGRPYVQPQDREV